MISKLTINIWVIKLTRRRRRRCRRLKGREDQLVIILSNSWHYTAEQFLPIPSCEAFRVCLWGIEMVKLTETPCASFSVTIKVWISVDTLAIFQRNILDHEEEMKATSSRGKVNNDASPRLISGLDVGLGIETHSDRRGWSSTMRTIQRRMAISGYRFKLKDPHIYFWNRFVEWVRPPLLYFLGVDPVKAARKKSCNRCLADIMGVPFSSWTWDIWCWWCNSDTPVIGYFPS